VDRQRARPWALLVAVVFGRAAYAAPTGLNQIPTTDVVPLRQVSLQVANGNSDLRGDDSVFHQPEIEPQSEFGLPWDIESGLDVAPANSPNDYQAVFNAKWSPLHEDYWVPAGAVGAMQLGNGFAPSYFLVLSKTLNYDQIQYQKFRAHHRNLKLRGIRLHTGVFYNGYVTQAMIGSDVEVNDHFIVYADWLSAASSAVSLGGVLVIDQHLSIQASLLRQNNEDRLTGVLVNITHTFDLTHPFEW